MKRYLLIPIVCLAIFAGYYIHWNKGAVEREKAREEQRVLDAAEAKAKMDAYNKEMAEKARKDAEERNASILARKAKIKADRERLDNAIKALDEASVKLEDLTAQRSTVRDELFVERDLLERGKEKKDRLLAEAKFLDEYTPISDANTKRLKEFFAQLDVWSKAEAEAAKSK